jgi:hypothetical protein
MKTKNKYNGYLNLQLENILNAERIQTKLGKATATAKQLSIHY